MRGRDSGDLFPVRGRFETVEPPHRLVATHPCEDAAGETRTVTRVTITLAAEGTGRG